MTDPGARLSAVLSTALCTDRYELTMLDAAVASGRADVPATFEVFARRLPEGRTHGVFAGVGRLLDALDRFRFGPDQLAWLVDEGVIGPHTAAWLRDHPFAHDIWAYPEGELYTAGSPVLTVEASFGAAVVLETLVLSVLNHDSAVAAAAELLVHAAGDRPLIEMGSRRTDMEAAIGAARAAYLAGFATTSNLEAGRRYGVPTAGTSAHAFMLLYPTEAEAFAAQVASLGVGTTLLVDTFDTERGIRTAVEVVGPGLGAIRIDSGDLAVEARRARRLLDDLGATSTRIVVTGDLDAAAIRALRDAPVDGYGVGTSLVTGLGAATAGFVYKLVAVGSLAGDGPTDEAASAVGGQHAVAKHSPGKVSVGGRKWAWRARLEDMPLGEDGALADVVATAPEPAPAGGRPLLHPLVERGRILAQPSMDALRRAHRSASRELAEGAPLVLARLPIAHDQA